MNKKRGELQKEEKNERQGIKMVENMKERIKTAKTEKLIKNRKSIRLIGVV